ncbi:MAG TPA: nuclear transport factor 2 family protein [Acidobacteriaceae bacterium]|nr:nuclear transport factor 2 family protein [Acidobacteriaceae bacterium]
MRAQCHSSIRPSEAQSLARGSVGILLLLLWLPASHATSIPHPHPQPRQVVHIIEKLECLWQKAELTGNTATMANMLSEDYLGIDGDGTLATKAETIASFRKGKTKFTQIHTWDRKIRVFGSTAVVVSKAHVTGEHDGESLSGYYRYTRVYHRRNGVWRIVSFEASTSRPRRQGQPAAPGAESAPIPTAPPQ